MTSRQLAIGNTHLAYKTLLSTEDPDNIYLDILITNVGSYTTSPPAIIFNEARQSPYINKPQDYEMSIIRFQCDTSTLPVIVPLVKPNQPDPNLTVYSISMQYQIDAGHPIVQVSVPIMFEPQDLSQQVPGGPSSNPNGLQTISPYYYYYNYQSFIYIIFKAFQACFNALDLAVSGYLTANHVLAPTINWDTTTNTATIFCETPWYDTSIKDPTTHVITTNPYNIRVYFNTPLYYLFNSFVFVGHGDNAPNNQNYELIVGSFGINTVYVPPTLTPTTGAVPCNVLYQEYSTISLWTPVTSLVFTTTLLPVIPTQLTRPLLFNDNAVIDSLNGTNANFINQITDISLYGDQYVPSVIYNPTAQYRFISLNGSQPLNQIDILVYWKTRFGTFIPLTLESGGTCSLKIYFRKKRFLTQDKDNN